jgi:hypothetical protein
MSSDQEPPKMQNPQGGKTPLPRADSNSWKIKFNNLFTRLELMGVRTANKVHRGFINCVLLFIAWNAYSFTSNYNNYWRLRRDPNIPKQWLEE